MRTRGEQNTWLDTNHSSVGRANSQLRTKRLLGTHHQEHGDLEHGSARGRAKLRDRGLHHKGHGGACAAPSRNSVSGGRVQPFAKGASHKVRAPLKRLAVLYCLGICVGADVLVCLQRSEKRVRTNVQRRDAAWH